jgi:hypothetical protein
MRAELKSLDLDPDPSTLPDDPAEFSFLARMIVGPPGTPGEESFDVTVCSPEWLAEASRRVGGIYNPRHALKPLQVRSNVGREEEACSSNE